MEVQGCDVNTPEWHWLKQGFWFAAKEHLSNFDVVSSDHCSTLFAVVTESPFISSCSNDKRGHRVAHHHTHNSCNEHNFWEKLTNIFESAFGGTLAEHGEHMETLTGLFAFSDLKGEQRMELSSVEVSFVFRGFVCPSMELLRTVEHIHRYSSHKRIKPWSFCIPIYSFIFFNYFSTFFPTEIKQWIDMHKNRQICCQISQIWCHYIPEQSINRRTN